MRYPTFSEYVQMREGLLLPDRPVTPGGLRINRFPTTQARLKQMKPKPVKPATTPPTKPKPATKPVALQPLWPFKPKAPTAPQPMTGPML